MHTVRALAQGREKEGGGARMSNERASDDDAEGGREAREARTTTAANDDDDANATRATPILQRRRIDFVPGHGSGAWVVGDD